MPSPQENEAQVRKLLDKLKRSKIGSARSRVLRFCLRNLLYIFGLEIRDGNISRRKKSAGKTKGEENSDYSFEVETKPRKK